ncbi:TNF receptor-associated factor 4-like [Clytia hemisphaerica]|uniref:RING-type domain-containing protein n=1 Tax=Clytia hemisphaerica TaxID=252671 RepID=A0A7M5V9Y1_9CNID|eukprot:TCONS_00039524-protein
MATYNPIHVGYDVTFVGEDEKTSALNAGQKEFAGGINKDDITCAICHLILREPVQAVKCGHRFCTKCIGEFHQTNPEKCPMDWQTIQVFPDIGKKREILNLQIRCQNHEEGCVWQNEIRELENHLKNCGYQKVPCELKCGENVLQKNGTKVSLDKHIAQSKYQHLSLEMKHEIGKVKNDFDEKFQNEKLQIEDKFDRKLKEKYEEIQNVKAQCNQKLQKIERDFDAKLIEKHQEIKDLKEEFGKIKNDLDEIKMNDKTEEHFKNLNGILVNKNELTFGILRVPRCPYTFLIENFKTKFDKAKKTNDIIHSPHFFTVNGYKGDLEVHLNGQGAGKNTHISVFFQILNGPYDDLLKWPIPWKSYSFILLINDKEVDKYSSKSTDEGGKWKDIFKRPTGDVGEDLGYPKAFSHELVKDVTDTDKVAFKYNMTFY